MHVCLFCLLLGINRKNKQHVKYPEVPSAIKPVPHGPGIPIPNHPDETFLTQDSEDELHDAAVDDDADGSPMYEGTSEMNQPKPLRQSELNNLTRDLGLSKESAQLLGSRLRENNLLSSETTFYWYRHREREFRKYFTADQSKSLTYCNDVKGLINELGVEYVPVEWRLFIDSSTKSLKAVLLNNGNKKASVPVGFSVMLTETYDNLKHLIQVLNYETHNWKICGDMKVRIYLYFRNFVSLFI